MSVIWVHGRKYAIQAFKVQPDSNFDNIWMYSFKLKGTKILSDKKYQTKKECLNAAEARICDLVRNKLRKPMNLADAMCVAEHHFINEYYNNMGECPPAKLFNAQAAILEKCISAYIEQAKIVLI